MKSRTLIIGIGILVVVILMVVAIFSAVGSTKLALKSDQQINSVTVNGTSMTFTQGMKIDYKQQTTIEVAQNGYDKFSVTLDPSKDKMSEYTIKLTKTSNAPVGSENYNLVQAAQSTDDTGLLNGNDLNVTIQNTKKFSADYVLYTVVPKDGNGDPAMVIAQKHNTGYQIILGPGTNFSQSDLFGLPDDLVSYLKSIGVGASE